MDTFEENKRNQKLISELKNYDIYDLIAKISALNIFPENQNKSAIFDTIINLLLSENPDEFNSKNKIGSNKLRTIINAWIDVSLTIMIDPIEMPFIQRVQFFGNKWIFSGINKSSGFNLQNFIDIIFKNRNDFNPNYVHDVSLFLELILYLSSSIVSKMGYSLETLKHYEEHEIKFFNTSKLDYASQCLIFPISDINQYIDKEQEKNLWITFGENNRKYNKDFDNFDFFYHPFVKTNEETIIVLNPSMLVPFSIHYMILLADKYGDKENLIRAYNDEVWRKCKKFLYNLKHKKIKEESLGFECYSSSSYKESLFNVGNDGILFVKYIFDDGQKYEHHKMFDMKTIKDVNFDGRSEKLKNKVPELVQNKIYQLVIISGFGRTLNCSFEDKSNIPTITLTPFELEIISINEKDHKFFLPRYLDSKNCLLQTPFMHMSEFNYLTFYADNNYSFYSNDDVDIRKANLLIGFGDSIDYIVKAIKKEDKHLVEYPDSNYLREIKINDKLRNIYYDTSFNNFALINKFNNINIWNVCELPKTKIDLNIKSSLIDLVSYWLSEYKQIIEQAEFKSSSIVIKNVILGEDKDYLLVTDKNEKNLEDLLDIQILSEYLIQINWNSKSYQAFIGNEHNAEKILLKIIIEKLSLLTKNKTNLKFEHNIFSNKLKTKIFSVDYQTHPYYKPITSNFTEISTECIDKLLNDIGDWLIQNKGLSFGIITENKNKVCTEIVGYLYNKLNDELNKYNINNFYNIIYHDLEIIIYQLMLSQKRYVADIACYPEKIDIFEKKYNSLNDSSIASKFLLEYVATCPPNGVCPLGEMDYEYLLAICSLIIEWAHNADLFYYNMIDNHLEMLESGRIGFKKENVERLAKNNLSAAKKKLSESSNPFLDTFSPKNIVDLEMLNNAYFCENGYTFSQFTTCIYALLDLGEILNEEIKEYNLSEVLIQISQKTSVEVNIVEKIIEDLSLSQRDDYLKPEPPFDVNDVYPWKFNRRLSINRKPIIRTKEKIIWGNRQLYHCLLFTYDVISDGRYKATSKEMKAYIGQVANNRGKDFNTQVYEKINNYETYIVRRNIRKIGGLKITNENNQDLGDIDLLIINPPKRKIIIVETKDFSFAKTPYELNQQYKNIFCDTDKKPCYITKHKKRVEWVKNHMDAVKKEYSLKDSNWKIDDLLIVSEPIVSNEFYNKKQKILLFSEITDSIFNNL